jgi:hypothetical protein
LADLEQESRDSLQRDSAWHLTREKILMAAGLAIAASELVLTVVDPAAFHYEFLIFGGSLCGISITQWGDKKK